jgi:hypothetical protein
MKPYRGPPMTLGNAADARVHLTVWCKACGHRSEPDPAVQARRYGPETTVPERRRRLVCSKCGSRNVDMVVTGTRGERSVAAELFYVHPPVHWRDRLIRERSSSRKGVVGMSLCGLPSDPISDLRRASKTTSTARDCSWQMGGMNFSV